MEVVMNRWSHRALPLIAALVVLCAPAARAQMAKQDAKQPSHALIRIYRIAPGKHLEFLKWLAEGDAIDKEAGVPSPQLYAHIDGDSWDYLGVGPDLTREQQAKVEEVSKKHGRKTGFASSLEFRTLAAWHTDTFVMGPVSASDLVAMASK
jgi:hypothetical protein